MDIAKDKVLELLVEEKQHIHALYEAKIKHAWTVLILAMSIPVAVASFEAPEGLANLLHDRFAMLAACLVGNTIFAYALWIYREVYAYQHYIHALEQEINAMLDKRLFEWEGQFNPYSDHEKQIITIFGTIAVCMLVSSLLSLLFAADLIGINKQPPLPWYVIGPIGFCYGALLFAALRIAKGMSPTHNPKS